MEAREIFEVLKARFGDAIVELQEGTFKPPFVVVAPDRILEVARFLRDDPGTGFDSLMCLSGVDYKDRFAVAYHLDSLAARHRVGLKVFLPREKPELPSVDSVWPVGTF